jgi:hypothetical protein
VGASAVRLRSARVATTLVAVAILGLAVVAPARAEFGLRSFSTTFTDAAGNAMNLAGGHPDMTTIFRMNEVGGAPDGTLRNVEIDLPPGLYGDPSVAGTCAMAELIASEGFCPPAAQVGTVFIEFVNAPSPLPQWELSPMFEFPIYAMASTSQQATVLGADVFNTLFRVGVSPRTGSDYSLTAKISNLNQGIINYATKLVLWGVPADPVNDARRFFGFDSPGASAGLAPRPFLSLPARCAEVRTEIRIASWQQPEIWHSGSDVAPRLSGCDGLRFEPKLDAHPQGEGAGAPASFAIDLALPQSDAVNGQATPQLRRASIALPAGLTVSPGAAAGLRSCSDEQLALGTATEPSCPPGAKIGTARIDAPVLKGELSGDILLGTPRPGELLRIFLVVRGFGVLMKIPGVARPDPQSGQLTAIFEEMPQLPFESVHLEFRGGPRAVLATPASCGVYGSRAELTSWASPVPVSIESSFPVAQTCGRDVEFAPLLEAGTESPRAGSYSPFVFRLLGRDGQQNIAKADVTLPAGVLARLVGVPRCDESSAASGACPAASRVGSSIVGVGRGQSPLYVPQPGRGPAPVFLAGPHAGAPYSLVVVLPTQAGPFDFGNVVVRSALFVNPVTAQLRVETDPLPQLIEGVPIVYRDIRLTLDRPHFTLNPTSCQRTDVRAALASAAGRTATASAPFRATGCGRLGFRPRLALRLSGPTHRSAHPRLGLILHPRPGDTNIGSLAITLPATEYLDTRSIRNVCSRRQYAKGSCPADSVYGHAEAWSPLLGKPLRGPVYLRESSRRLPDLVAALDGRIHLDLVGRIDSVDARVRSTFESVPDVPLHKLTLSMRGGRRGLLVNNAGLCGTAPRALVQLEGHSGRWRQARPLVQVDCAQRRHTGTSAR